MESSATAPWPLSSANNSDKMQSSLSMAHRPPDQLHPTTSRHPLWQMERPPRLTAPTPPTMQIIDLSVLSREKLTTALRNLGLTWDLRHKRHKPTDIS